MSQSRLNFFLMPSLLMYAVLASILSLIQYDYVCADFVAYVTVARRFIETPWQAITPYWSPLFSWTMIPLLLAGVNDMIAGRIILLVSGVIYLSTIYLLSLLHRRRINGTDRLVQIGVMTCATLQASIWSTYLLDPDLLANGILYAYFCVVSVRHNRVQAPKWAFLAGILAGVSYLAKAYMLPFCLLHFALTMGLRFVSRKRPAILRFADPRMWQEFVLFGLGLGLVAGPWITCLSNHCGKLTFTTAGSANHANVSPENFMKDVLWHPGVNQDFIFEPNLTPDWSPLQDSFHFQHQVGVIRHNVFNCVGLIPIWCVLFAVSLGLWRLLRIKLHHHEMRYVNWVTMTIVVYCAGYCTVNLEARYIAPTVVPLLCHASLLILTSVTHERLSDARHRIVLNDRARLFAGEESRRHTKTPHSAAPRTAGARSKTSIITYGDLACSNLVPQVGNIKTWVVPRILVFFQSRPGIGVAICVLALSAVEIHSLIRIATKHPQSLKFEKYRVVAEHLRATGLADYPITCNDWHIGLFVSHAADCLKNYWGCPISHSEHGMLQELDSNNVKVFLRFVRVTKPSAYYPFAKPFSNNPYWTQKLTIRDSRIVPDIVEVYVRR